MPQTATPVQNAVTGHIYKIRHKYIIYILPWSPSRSSIIIHLKSWAYPHWAFTSPGCSTEPSPFTPSQMWCGCWVSLCSAGLMWPSKARPQQSLVSVPVAALLSPLQAPCAWAAGQLDTSHPWTAAVGLWDCHAKPKRWAFSQQGLVGWV